MKNLEGKMKKLINAVLSIAFLLTMVNCSDDTDPKFRIHNEMTDKANVQIQTTGGNTININDVEAGQTTEYQIATEGNITATAVIQNESTSPSVVFFASNDERYTVVIQANNPPSLRVDKE